MKHLLSRPHILFSVENPLYPDKAETSMSVEDAVKFLSLHGYNDKKNVHAITGHYGSPEKSILISDPTDEQRDYAKLLSQMTGQESHIESDGLSHKMFYHHGDNAGKVGLGRGTVFHEVKPHDFYSQLPDGTTFTHNFDDGMEKAIKSPSKHIPLARLKQIKQDNAIGEGGQEYSEEELNDAIMDRKMSDAERMVREADRMQAYRGPKLKMAKGARGDWKNEGYLLRHIPPKEYDEIYVDDKPHSKMGAHYFEALDNDGNKVGHLTVFHDLKTKKIQPEATWVKKNHQRKGLATALYKLAEQKLKAKMLPSEKQTPEAKALWSQPKRPFGKSNYGPQGYGAYSQTDNARRKMGRTGENVGLGPNSEVRFAGPTRSQQAEMQARLDRQKSKKNPVKTFSPEERKRLASDRGMMAASEMEKGRLSATVAAGMMALAPHAYDAAQKAPQKIEQTAGRIKHENYHNDQIARQNNLKGYTTWTTEYGHNPVTGQHDHAPKMKFISAHDQITGKMKDAYWAKQPKGPSIGPAKKSLQKSSLPQVPSIKLNPEHGRKIAEAYHNMKHDPNHPEVKAAYGALIDETKKQFKDMLSQGFKFSAIKPNQENPYKTSKDLHADLKQNKHMHFFPTDQGYGSEGQQVTDHPMLQPTEFVHEGKPLLANDLFRIVHDYRGHHLGGESTFGPKGEHQAYLTHKKDFSPLAQKALASETLGQNSWVNFSSQVGEHNRKNPHKTIYAEQKAGLLPDEIVNGRWHES